MVTNRTCIVSVLFTILSAFLFLMVTTVTVSFAESNTGWSALGSGVGGAMIPIDYASGYSLEGEIAALIVAPDDTLYAAGSFQTAGGVQVGNIAKWNGSRWFALGSGLNTVGALALAPNGELYAADVNTVLGEKISIAKWDGNSWSAVASSTGIATGSIRALAVAPNGTLYAAGFLPWMGGEVHTIYKWNGKNWKNIGPGLANANQGFVADVRSLAVAPDGTLYAGGIFTSIGRVKANSIAKWDGTSWSALGSGMDGKSAVSIVVVAPNGDLYAGGDFSKAGGVKTNGIAKWNGSSWSAIGAGLGAKASVSALAVAPDGTVYAGGGGLKTGKKKSCCVAKWNGASWVSLGTGVDEIVNALALGPDGTLYAGGWFTKAGGKKVNYIAQWKESK